MANLKINVASMAINVAIGWFVLSFLQALIRSLIAADVSTFWARFLAIALFKNGQGVVINAIVIIVFGGIGTTIWFLAKK